MNYSEIKNKSFGYLEKEYGLTLGDAINYLLSEQTEPNTEQKAKDLILDTLKLIEIKKKKVHTFTYSKNGRNDARTFLKKLWNTATTTKTFFSNLDEVQKKEQFYRSDIIISQKLKVEIGNEVTAISNNDDANNRDYISINQNGYVEAKNNLLPSVEANNNVQEFVDKGLVENSNYSDNNGKFQYFYTECFLVNDNNEYEDSTGYIYELLKLISSDNGNNIEDAKKFLKNFFYKRTLERYREKETFVGDVEEKFKRTINSKKILAPYEKLNGKAGKIGNLKTISSSKRNIYFNSFAIDESKLIFNIDLSKIDSYILDIIKDAATIEDLTGETTEGTTFPTSLFPIKPVFLYGDQLNNINVDFKKLEKFYYANKNGNKSNIQIIKDENELTITIDTEENNIITIDTEENNIQQLSSNIGGYLITGYQEQLLSENRVSKTKKRDYSKSSTYVLKDNEEIIDFTGDHEFSSLFDDRDFVITHKLGSFDETETTAATRDRLSDIKLARIYRDSKDELYLIPKTIDGRNNSTIYDPKIYLSKFDWYSIHQIKFMTNDYFMEGEENSINPNYSTYDPKKAYLFEVKRIDKDRYRIYLKDNCVDKSYYLVKDKGINENQEGSDIYITEILQRSSVSPDQLSIPDPPDYRNILTYDLSTLSYNDNENDMEIDSSYYNCNYNNENNELNITKAGDKETVPVNIFVEIAKDSNGTFELGLTNRKEEALIVYDATKS